jgi:hypothetical protein
MNTLRTAASLAVAAAFVGLASASMPALAGDSAKVRVDFAKCFPNPPLPLPPGVVFINVGTASGDVTGALAVYGQPGSFTSVGGSTIYLEADYEVTATDPDKSFTARVGGRYDLGIGRAVLYGFVSEGWLLGAEVVDEFHATTPGCVAGTLVITPRWSHPADAQ